MLLAAPGSAVIISVRIPTPTLRRLVIPITNSIKYSVAALCVAAAGLSPTLACAQASQPADKWQVSASINGYLPTLGGTTSFPGSGSSVEVGADTIIDNFKMTFMGSLDVHNGRWGVFNDVLYLDLGNSKSGTRDFTLGNLEIPAGVSANLNYDLKGTIWTVAGEYRLASGNPAYTIDLLVGARYFTLKQTLGYAISGTGTDPLIGTSGTREVSGDVWDGIIGAKGRYAFGQNRQWFVPYYLDVGTGQSDLTWQAAAGVGYTYSWGELTAMWRYLDYDFESDSKIQSINFNGPMFGATFRW